LYALYLVATGLGTAPKLAMTALYVVASFRHFSSTGAPNGIALLRYCTAYASGSVLNYAMLAVFVDVLRIMHEDVQGVAGMLVGVTSLRYNAFGYSDGRRTWDLGNR
jgi:hypothetical protein